MSELNKNCSEARELLNATLVLDAAGGDNSFDLQVRNHIDECSNCYAWAKQMKEIETVASSMAQYDVPESLTQSILRAVDAESVQHKSVKSSLLLPAVFAALMAVFFIIETQESVGGIISWAAGLAVMYSVSLLVSSNNEAETA